MDAAGGTDNSDNASALSLLIDCGLCENLSLEITPGDLRGSQSPDRALRQLAKGARIFISHLERDSLEQSLRLAGIVAEAGLISAPHIVARHYRSEKAPRQTLDNFYRLAGVEEIMLLAGDRRQASACYRDSLEALRSGALNRLGLKKLWFAGHPEGRRHASAPALRGIMDEKIRRARQAGLECAFITQLCFATGPFMRWMGAQASGLTIHPDVFIYARQSSLLHLAGLIDTPPPSCFLTATSLRRS